MKRLWIDDRVGDSFGFPVVTHLSSADAIVGCEGVAFPPKNTAGCKLYRWYRSKLVKLLNLMVALQSVL